MNSVKIDITQYGSCFSRSYTTACSTISYHSNSWASCFISYYEAVTL